jgi:hypothetical protein
MPQAVRTSKIGWNSAAAAQPHQWLSRTTPFHYSRDQTATVLVIFLVDVGADSIRILINQWNASRHLVDLGRITSLTSRLT